MHLLLFPGSPLSSGETRTCPAADCGGSSCKSCPLKPVTILGVTVTHLPSLSLAHTHTHAHTHAFPSSSPAPQGISCEPGASSSPLLALVLPVLPWHPPALPDDSPAGSRFHPCRNRMLLHMPWNEGAEIYFLSYCYRDYTGIPVGMK